MRNNFIVLTIYIFGTLLQSCKPLIFQNKYFERIYIYPHRYSSSLFSSIDRKTLQDRGKITKNDNILVLTSNRGPNIGVNFTVKQMVDKSIPQDSVLITIKYLFESGILETMLEYNEEYQVVGEKGRLFKKAKTNDGIIVHSPFGDFPLIYRQDSNTNVINIEYISTNRRTNYFRYSCTFFNEPFLLKKDTLINLRTFEYYFKH